MILKVRAYFYIVRVSAMPNKVNKTCTDNALQTWAFTGGAKSATYFKTRLITKIRKQLSKNSKHS